MTKLKTLPAILFTPGNRLNRFSKAQEAGANGIILDLEDAVAVAEKDQAREIVFNYLSTKGSDNFARIVRINSLSTEYGLTDLLKIAAHPKLYFDAILYPKAESSVELNIIHSVLKSSQNNVPIIAIIESLNGLKNIDEIVSNSRNIEGVMFGAADFSVEMNSTLDFQSLLYSRSKIVLAATARDLAIYDTPFFNFSDEPALIAESLSIKNLGFTGKAAIHPAQISAIKSVFKPSDETYEEANEIIRIYEKAKGAACQYKGKMIDVPVYKKAVHTVQIYDVLNK
jgi:(S)-citramalyl-CoA lyase